jgi:hypothetical protein
VEFALSQEKGTGESPRTLLSRTWGDEAAEPARESCLRLVEEALPRLEEWRK